MIDYDLIVPKLKSHFFIIFSEKFYQKNSGVFIERFVAKHALLRPKLIVVNDQVHGFKKMSQHVASLEKFPIFIEIEGQTDDDGNEYITNIDLYSEANISCQDRLSDIIYLSNSFKKTVSLDRVLSVNNPTKENMVIFSKLQSLLPEIDTWINYNDDDDNDDDDDDDDDDDSLDEGADINLVMDPENTALLLDDDSELTSEQLSVLIDICLTSFTNFVKLLDDILVKGKSLKNIEHIFQDSESI